MNPVVYLNGKYLKPDEAQISIFDRGCLFGDAVYEVAGVMDGKLIDFDAHMTRLSRSLTELSIPQPMDKQVILEAYRTLVTQNQIVEGLVYMQITRGEADRDFIWSEGLVPNVFMFTQHQTSDMGRLAKSGLILISVPDIRWARRDIKSVNLLGQVLAKQQAKQAGGDEALMIDAEGYITECGATSFFMIKDNCLVTRPLSSDILPGVTRQAILQLCEANTVRLQERCVRLDEALNADEAFITGASTYVLGVRQIDECVIATGRPGPLTGKMREIYMNHAKRTAI